MSPGARNVNEDLFVLHKETNQLQTIRKTRLKDLD